MTVHICVSLTVLSKAASQFRRKAHFPRSADAHSRQLRFALVCVRVSVCLCACRLSLCSQFALSHVSFTADIQELALKWYVLDVISAFVHVCFRARVCVCACVCRSTPLCFLSDTMTPRSIPHMLSLSRASAIEEFTVELCKHALKEKVVVSWRTFCFSFFLALPVAGLALGSDRVFLTLLSRSRLLASYSYCAEREREGTAQSERRSSTGLLLLCFGVLCLLRSVML